MMIHNQSLSVTRQAEQSFNYLLLCLLGLFLFIANGASADTGQGDWWMFHHDPQHTGRSPFIGPSSPVQKWGIPTEGMIDSSPAIGADGTIYVGSFDGHLYAFNPDGTQQWAFPTGGVIWSSPAIGADGTIYVGSNDYHLYAINPDGTQKWTFKTGNAITASPAIGINGTIYIGSWDGNFHAINPDGTPLWVFPTGAVCSTSPALGKDGTIYLWSNENLFAITTDGKQEWVISGYNYYHNWASPAIGGDGSIYIGSLDGNLYAINSDGKQEWAFPTGKSIDSTPAIGLDGTIYVGSTDDNLYAINPTGTRQWLFPTNNSIASSPAIGADGTIYVGSNDDNLYAINPDGMRQWVFPTKNSISSSPAIGADGTIYFGSEDDNFYAITNSPTIPLTSVTLSATPLSPVMSGTPVNLLATADGGTNVLFQFWIYNPAANPAWSQLQAYSSSADCSWTPAVAGSYLLSVTAQDATGTTANIMLWYTVNNAPLTAVSVSASPNSPQLVNTPITFTACATGGTNVQYQFWIYNQASNRHGANCKPTPRSPLACGRPARRANTFSPSPRKSAPARRPTACAGIPCWTAVR